MQGVSTRPPNFNHSPALVWWSHWDIVRAGGRSCGFLAVLLAVAAVTVVAGLLTGTWYGIPVHLGGLTFGVTFYLPVGISLLVSLCMGPVWGISCAYIANVAVAVTLGVPLATAAVLAMSTPIALLILWTSMVMLEVPPSLDTVWDWGRFGALALLSTSASSVGAIVWNFSRGLALDRARAVWQGWVLGDFLQLTLIAGPVLHFGYRPVSERIAALARVRPRSALTTRKYIGLFLVVFALIIASALETARLLVDSPGFASGAWQTGTAVESNREVVEAAVSFVGAYLFTFLALVMVFSLTLGVIMERHKNSARTDMLTGCLNRRAFAEVLVSPAADPDRGVSLLMIDVDHFKLVNDTHGHAAGDALLRALADRIQGLIRRSDYLFRWGGEEFAVLLPDTAMRAAVEIAERIRGSLAAQPISIAPGSVRVTVSIGVTSATDAGISPESLFDRADAACYRAKQNGRNRVEVAGPHLGAAGPRSHPHEAPAAPQQCVPRPRCQPSEHTGPAAADLSVIS